MFGSKPTGKEIEYKDTIPFRCDKARQSQHLPYHTLLNGDFMKKTTQTIIKSYQTLMKHFLQNKLS